ncbi:polyprenol monophosphomannose synthase [Corynebacterium jeikeium]|jgi:dolichol-phosphate mannosyltransferase|uniref:dolichyl-phosphate beta-D-mannosyltransferase n=1 Tax=Corynebacterium jeikeium (strain K411) TaxID=306537 RepID=Q4JVQ8_CORJK|nr:polyprenol monophosphomannose synthase [Corynebacterium jeikeium]EEW16470.1 glycosyltransferase, group 2 family protein [Corynebacterium jeikeium ATCC 43734]OOD34109.1 polyprenol monophosphomannose synthase [Corynebacterium jeikeium]WCZ53488.1 Undecaprenyl-phosphate mannosyltransferase [Corynebacterium jeikeium]CAI37099.1 polyprenol-phosphate-mannose synthase domain 1 [Corynebacterium jeikeium K411]SCX13842.1 Undecaprenyl-phosphate 4-deoxy-4-formamido-L-arabinose transferase [Corynebacteriu
MNKLSDKTLVIIPTYNERENLPLIIGRLLKAEPERVDVLVVDDSSPDGTGELADEMAAENPKIHVMHRGGKGGLGGAYIAGFHWGLERDYEILCEMDADGSHAPEQLYLLLDRIDAGAEMVLGSRYVKGGKTVNWPVSREVLSRGGNVYASVALGAGLSDITGGYRAYRREVLEGIDLDAVDSAGYVFQVDLAWRAVEAGFDVREVPITFTEREIGDSKMSGNIVSEALLQVTKWGAAHRFNQVKNLAQESWRIGAGTVRSYF